MIVIQRRPISGHTISIRSLTLGYSHSVAAPAVSFTYDLGQVKRVCANGVEDEILQSIHSVEQILAECCHCGWLLLLTGRYRFVYRGPDEMFLQLR